MQSHLSRDTCIDSSDTCHRSLQKPIRKGRAAMIDLHYWSTPNGHKITIFLEETGLEYKVFPVNSGKGDKLKPVFVGGAPNNGIPALVDHAQRGGEKPISIFESGAML